MNQTTNLSAPMSDSDMNGENNGRDQMPLLLSYWQIIKRRKWLIAAILLLALATGVVLTLLATPTYTANARIEIQREQQNVTNVETLEDSTGGNSLEFYQTQYALLQSRNLAERVARQLRLADNQAFFEAHGSDITIPETATGRRDSNRRLDRAIRILLNNISINPVRGSSLVDVSYTSATPAISQQVANSWAEQFIEESIARRFESSADARKFLETRLADLRSRLEDSERALVTYAENKGIVTIDNANPGPDGGATNRRTLTSDDLVALNASLAQATADRIAAQSRLANSGNSAEALSNPTLTGLRQRLALLEAQYDEMMVRFEPGYPAAQALNERIKSIRQSMTREESRIAGSIRSQLREAQARESGLEARVASLKQQTMSERNSGIQYNIYQREADTNRQLYDALLQRYKELGVAGVGVSNIAVVDEAERPGSPSSPNLMFNLILSLLAGSVLAGVGVLALQQVDEGLREPNDVKTRLGLGLLGATPSTVEGRDEIVEELLDPKSGLYEAYLTIKSNLGFATEHGVPRSIMVTSTREAEGKSTSSLAIATVLARTGSSVILIDSDMRSPSLQTLLKTENKQGLSNYLSGHDEWRELVEKSDITNLSIMMAGPMPPNAAELLSGSRISQIVSELGEHFDHVVIDAPPLLGLADATLIAQSVEGSVVVIEYDRVPIRGLQQAIDRLRGARRPIFGAVVTKMSEEDSSYGYGYGYGHSYGSDRQESDEQ